MTLPDNPDVCPMHGTQRVIKDKRIHRGENEDLTVLQCGCHWTFKPNTTTGERLWTH